MIHDIRDKAFTQRIIRSSFRSRGIYPFDPEAILAPLRQAEYESEGAPLRIILYKLSIKLINPSDSIWRRIGD
jgi:hypothetical protein